MEYKYRSIKSLLSDLDDDFNFQTNDFFYKAVGWIARALEIMNFWVDSVPVTKTITLTEGKGVLPCDIKYIMFFSKDGYYYRIKSDFVLESQCACPDNLGISHHTVIVNPKFVFANSSLDSINIHYYSIPTDEEGFPLIIDNAEVTEAINWYIAYKMILSGYKHPTIKDWKEARAMWETHYPRAQNTINFPSVRRAQELVNNFTLIAKDNNLIKYFFTK